MKRWILAWALAAAALAAPASAADYVAERTLELPPTRWRLDVDFPLVYGERLLWDTAYLVSAPVRWETPDWARFGVFAAATGGTLGADRTIDVESRRRHPRSGSERDVENGIEEFGSLPGIAGIAGGAAVAGLLADSDFAKAISADSIEAVVLSGIFTAAGKEMVGRSRPRDADGPFTFHPFSGAASFPSGHTTTAFALASVVSEHFENRLWVAAPLYALAGGVGLARTRANAHFASDVLVGAAIGAATGRTVVDLERRRLGRVESAGGPAVSVEPTFAPGFSGVALSLRF
jgi:PAP2 superfamily protein